MISKRHEKKFTAAYRNSEFFYILKVQTANAMKRKNEVTPRLFESVARILKHHGYRMDADAFTAAIASEQSVTPFTEREILALDVAAALAILAALANADGKERDTLGESAAYTLRSLEQSDFDERYALLSRLESYLVKHHPVYAHCDKATKDDLKRRILAYAKKHRIGETAAASLFLSEQDPASTPKKAGVAFFLFLYLFSVLLTVLLLFAGVPFFLLPFLFFPVFESVKLIGEEIARRLLPSHPIPKLELETIPDDAKTAVVITTLFTKEDPEPFRRLERFFLANRHRNLRFGLLCDLKDAKEAVAEEDASLAAYAEGMIAALNEKYAKEPKTSRGNADCENSEARIAPFFFALRERRYSQSEGVFMGEERKRGAILDLVGYRYNESNAFSHLYGDTAFLKEIRYLVTLDADTDLFMGSVAKMVGAMLHPDNAPVIENGAVRKGYGILQPRMAVTTASASATRFSLLMCGSGGIDAYSSAGFDLYQNFFGEGIFCGKGIMDVAAFHELIPDAFEKEAILSHDALEGNLLRAGFLSDVTLTDSFPKPPLGFFNRLHRWHRGDLQALPYGLESPKNAYGRRHRNPASPLGRYRLFDNIRRIFTPIATVAALLLSLILSKEAELTVAILILFTYLVPLLLPLAARPSLRFRRYFSRILTHFGYRFMNLVFSLSSLAHLASVSSDATLRSAFRMLISKKHLLAWSTAAAEDQRKESAKGYLKATAGSLALGTVLLTFAATSPLRVLGLLWLVYPVFLVLLAHRFSKKPKPLSEAAKNKLTRYAFDSWNYYVKHVTQEDNFLPPDNVQKTPVRAIAHRTSPTNIGMYLLSCLAAKDFGFISAKELAERLDKTLATLERMPKKEGHLYNWYDTKTLALLGIPFVSTVDSGNFTVSLVTLCRGLKDYVEEEPRLRRLIFRYEKLIDETDFSYLYCPKRKLFYIARSSDEPSPYSCYDLYMSEARTTSYYAIAKGTVPKKHWERLARTVVGKGGYTGLASWSGTAFEYFMPHLFLPVLPSSLSEEALSFTVSCQKRYSQKGVWGISESAYYAFDADMNYQYRAHGVSPLALDSHIGKHPVVSPYSSFLMLKTAPHAALANLERLCELRAYGEYGFYEAVDFSAHTNGNDYAVIQNYMAHHVGMSMIAAANACFNDSFVRRFMSEPSMAAAKELLEERIPTDSPFFRGKAVTPEQVNRRHLPRTEEKKLRVEKKSDRIPKVALLSNRRLSLTVASSGEAALMQGKMAITYPVFSGKSSPTSSIRILFSHGNKPYAATPDLFSYSGTKAVFTVTKEKLTVRITFTLHGERDLLAVAFQASGVSEPISPTLVFQPILTSPSSFFSHPFYRALSIEASYSKEDGILYFHARKREDEGESYLALSLEAEGETAFETRKDVLPFGYGEKEVLALSHLPLPCHTGATVSPLAVLRKTLTPHAGKAEAVFLLAVGRRKSEVREHILSVRQKSGIAEAVSESLRPVVRRMLHALGSDRPDGKYAELYLSALTYPRKEEVALPEGLGIPTLWKASLSGDLPIVALTLREEESDSAARMVSLFLKLHRLMREKGLLSDLVFLVAESDSYARPLEKSVGRQIAKEGENGYIGKRGGIFLISDPGVAAVAVAASCLHVVLDKNTSPEELYYRVTGRKELRRKRPVTVPEKSPVTVPDNAFRVEGGYFQNQAFTVIKEEADGVRAYVYASSRFGTLLTASSLGYTWLLNAKESRLSEPSDNTHRDESNEWALAEKNGVFYDLAAMATAVTFSPSHALYCGSLNGEPYRLKVGIDSKLPVKLILAELPKGYTLHFEVIPSFGVAKHLSHTVKQTKEGKTLFYENDLSPHLGAYRAFVTPLEEENRKQGFLFGVFPKKGEGLYHLIRSRYPDVSAIEKGFSHRSIRFHNLFSAFRFHLPRADFELLMNSHLPYQIHAARLFGRTGYHQSGGAYGFRDQLQDVLAMLYFDPSLARVQILRAAARQYKEGDVQHWWHCFPDHTKAGVRTRISDDLLWLPYAVAAYCRISGDYGILETLIPYLDSPPLTEGEQDRYEAPEKTSHKESLYRHCMRAIDAASDFSQRGLPLIKDGDWNDAFNRVGHLGKGESIFLARFMQTVFHDFAPIVLRVGDKASHAALLAKAKRIRDAVEAYAYDSDRYLRATYDSGAPLGARQSRYCKLDSLTQCFSAITEGATDRVSDALRSAYDTLYDREHKLFKLFDPPFGNDGQEAGYVSAYCEGIRENGGQYNHGILFAAKGYFAAGEKQKAFELLEAVNPITRSMNPKLAKAYRLEPYALCGDIYTNPEHLGRGGWDLYTGGAGWFFRVVLEDLLGYREYGDYFTLSPNLTGKMPKYSMKLSKKNTVYHISVYLADREKTVLDGVTQHPNGKRMHFFFDGGRHYLEMDIEKREKL